jgi:carboxylesterase
MPILRGHGAESPNALRGISWSDWVDDAHLALQDLLDEAECAIIVGHSMGSLVTLTLAADHGDQVDSIILSAPTLQLRAIIAPGRPLGFLAPALTRLLDKWDMPPRYTDRELEQYDTNYPWVPMEAVASFLEFTAAARKRLPDVNVPLLVLQSYNDSTVAPESSDIVLRETSTPRDQKRVIWYEATEHEMFRDCEREDTTRAVVEYVQGRMAGGQPTVA